MRVALIITVCILFITELKAQEIETIEVDSVTFTPKKSIPFDKPFFMKIWTKELPPSIYIVEHLGNRSWTGTINKIVDQKKDYKLKEISAENFSVHEDGGKKYLLIKFGYHNPHYEYVEIGGFLRKRSWKYVEVDKGNNILEPRKGYTIILNKIHRESIKIFDLIAEKKIAESIALRQKMEDLSLRKFGLVYFTPSYENLVAFYDTSLLSNYLDIDIERGRFFNSFSDFESLIASSEFKSTISLLTDDKKLDVLKQLINVQSVYSDVSKILGLPDSLKLPLMNGLINLDDIYATYETDEIKKAANLEKTLNSLIQIKMLFSAAVTNNWFLHYGIRQPNGVHHLEETINILRSNSVIKKNIGNQYSQIEQKMKSGLKFLDPQLVTGSSYVYNFETRNKFQISPDFGYAVYGFRKGFTGFAPYLGFQVNLRAIDRDIPFSILRKVNRYPNKKFLHYISFMTAWSLTNIGEPNKRADFFESGSLMTGFGFRISNAVRITGGNFWFYRYNENPEIEGKKLTLAPFVALSLDINLKSLMNDITSLKPIK